MTRRNTFVLAVCFGVLLFGSFVPMVSSEIGCNIQEYAFKETLEKTLPTVGIQSTSHLKEPDDPSYSLQWGLDNRGSNILGQLGIIDADIDAPQAWEHGTNSSIIVAIIDTGADLSHTDLDGNIWHNPGETGGGKETDGNDNDGNGYVDDWRGWDFIDNDNDPQDQSLVGHGTHVAGIVGAEGNNKVGVAGVVWDIKLMILRTIGGTWAQMAEAIRYAVDNGAKIINISSQGYVDPISIRSVYEAIAYADQKGVLVVAAAGNRDSTVIPPRNVRNNDINERGEDLDGDTKLDTGEDIDHDGILDAGEDLDGDGVLDRTEDLDGDGVFDSGEDIDGDHRFDFVDEDTNGNGQLDGFVDENKDGRLDYPNYPSSFNNPNIIAVAASNNRDSLWGDSNYGKHSVDIAAPGEGIYSTVPASVNPAGYAYMDGTSFATPFVTGAAAHFWTLFPGLTHLQVKDWLLRRVDPRPGIAGRVLSGNNNDGRLRMISGDDFGDADLLQLTKMRYTGASHEDIGEEWLGGCNWTDVSPEFDADVKRPWDVDGYGNILFDRVPLNPEPPFWPINGVPDLDHHDDGIIPIGPWDRGQLAQILYSIRTRNEDIIDFDGGRYGGQNPLGDKLLYINIWIDWNQNWVWDPGELVFNATHNPTLEWNGKHCSGWKSIWVQVPEDAYPITWAPYAWVRARLDYGEDAGNLPRYDSDPSYIDTVGLAQFGEVEDYLIPSPKYIDIINAESTPMVWNITITWNTTTALEGGRIVMSARSIVKYGVRVLENGTARIAMQLLGVTAKTVLQITVNASGQNLGIFAVTAAILGDVNVDSIVDIFDIVTVAVAYGSMPNDPEWNPNADINCDGVIDIFDLVTTATHYGEIDP